MKMKKALDNVTLSQSQKEKMLHKIKNKNVGGQKYIYRQIILGVFILLFIVPVSVNEVITIESRFIIEPVDYTLNCLNLTFSEQELTYKLYDVRIMGVNYEVYESMNDNMLLYNGEYELLLECEEK